MMPKREIPLAQLIRSDIRRIKITAIGVLIIIAAVIGASLVVDRQLGLDKIKTTVNAHTPVASYTPVGKFKGYLNTWDIQNANGYSTRKGAFEESFKEKALFERSQGRNGTGIPVLFNHKWDLPIGIFTLIKEDSHGVYVEGEINLNTRQGADVFALMKQGVLTSMSISFYKQKEKKTEVCSKAKKKKAKVCKTIQEVILKGDVFEGSVVTFPADKYSRIEVVK